MRDELEHGITLQSIFRFLLLLRGRWLILLLCLLPGMAAGALAGYASYKAEYRLQIVLVVGGKDSRDAPSGSGLANAMQYQTLAHSYQHLLDSQQVRDALRRAVTFDLSDPDLYEAMTVTLDGQSTLITIAMTWPDVQQLSEMCESLKDIADSLLTRTWSVNHSWVDGYSEPVNIGGMPPMTRAKLGGVIGAVMGVLLGAAFIGVYVVADQNLSDLGGFAKKTGLDVLALLPAWVRLWPHKRNDSKYWDFRYRMQLILAKLFSEMQGEKVTLFLAEPSSRCGQSLVAGELALSSASTGKKTLLLDLVGRAKEDIGFQGAGMETRRKSTSMERFIREDELFYIGRRENEKAQASYDCFHLRARSGEMTVYCKMTKLGEIIGQLKSQYDVIVLAPPPLLEQEEWAMLAKQADTALLVFHQRRTKLHQVKSAVSLLNKENAQVSGCVINGVRNNDLRKPY